ncbi:hypothetical protein IWZ00DRAFT_243391 [Phyllosticta capitalensis]
MEEDGESKGREMLGERCVSRQVLGGPDDDASSISDHHGSTINKTRIHLSTWPRLFAVVVGLFSCCTPLPCHISRPAVDHVDNQHDPPPTSPSQPRSQHSTRRRLRRSTSSRWSSSGASRGESETKGGTMIRAAGSKAGIFFSAFHRPQIIQQGRKAPLRRAAAAASNAAQGTHARTDCAQHAHLFCHARSRLLAVPLGHIAGRTCLPIVHLASHRAGYVSR